MSTRRAGAAVLSATLWISGMLTAGFPRDAFGACPEIAGTWAYTTVEQSNTCGEPTGTSDCTALVTQAECDMTLLLTCPHFEQEVSFTFSGNPVSSNILPSASPAKAGWNGSYMDTVEQSQSCRLFWPNELYRMKSRLASTNCRS